MTEIAIQIYGYLKFKKVEFDSEEKHGEVQTRDEFNEVELDSQPTTEDAPPVAVILCEVAKYNHLKDLLC